jgi:4-hydroxy-2-oxoheptanedioate aldolase
MPTPRVRPSRVLAKLRGGQAVHVASSLPEPWNVELLGLLDYDCAWIDSEHNEMPETSVAGLAVAGRASDVDTMVRIRNQGYADYFRFLEVGCSGILVPHCDSAEIAREVVRNARFAPAGQRSLGGLGADAVYGMVPLGDYLEQANSETFVAVQIESQVAVGNVREIAAVEGVDILFVGPGDLSLDMGHPGQLDHPELRAALERVSEAAAEAGKWWGLPVGSPERVRDAHDLGARFIVFGSAKGLLINGYKGVRQAWAKLFGAPAE